MATLALTLILCAAIVNQAAAGVIYTRWGRNTCGPGSQLIYKGYAGGSLYNDPGNGANYLCLPPNPDKHPGSVPGRQQYAGSLFGVEYELDGEFTDNHPLSFANNLGTSLQDNDVVCSVCYNSKASAQLMIPAKNKCPSSDMHLEYTGVLMSDWYGHSRTEYICMDQTPEVVPGGQANQNGGLLYVVRSVCGSLKCPPYEPEAELACVVCTI